MRKKQKKWAWSCPCRMYGGFKMKKLYLAYGSNINLEQMAFKGYRENGFDEKYLVDALKQAFDYEQKIKQEECEEIAEESEELEEGIQMTME